MSAPLSPADVLHLQRLYACAGFYQGKLDGLYGPRTGAAAVSWDHAYAAIRTEVVSLGPSTEALLHGILPVAQGLVRRLLKILLSHGLTAEVVSGTRSYPEQDALFRQGRWGDKRPRVTNARAGQSLHNFGIAVDVGLFKDGAYLQDSPLYDQAGELSRQIQGLEWGGDWRSIKDRPHYQLATGLGLAELRRRFEAGERIP